MLQKLKANRGFESRAALGRVLYGCETLPDDRISHGAFVSAAGSEAGAAAPVLELGPEGGFSRCGFRTVFTLAAGCSTWLVLSRGGWAVFGLLLQLNFRKLCQLDLGRCCCAVTRTKGHSESGLRVWLPFLLSVVFAPYPSKSKDGLESIPVVVGPLGGGQGWAALCLVGPCSPCYVNTDCLEDHWGIENSLVIPGGSIHALLSNFLNTCSDFSVSVEPELLLGEALLGCFLELPLNYLILVTV